MVRRLSEQLGYLMNNNIITRMLSKQGEEIPLSVTVPLHGNTADTTATLDLLLPHTISSDLPLSRIFHIDVSPSVSITNCNNVSTLSCYAVLLTKKTVELTQFINENIQAIHEKIGLNLQRTGKRK